MSKYTFILTIFILFLFACGEKTAEQDDKKTTTNTTNSDPSNTQNWKDEKRFALVIGNADYDAKGITPLKNPVNDADAVSKTLQGLQFEVTTVTNADRDNMWDAIDKFVEKLAANPASVGLFYYAGHGLELKGTNYLLPVSVKVGSQNPESDVDRDAYKLQDLITRLENAKNRMNMIFLDACRDNPFPKLTRSIASRGMTSVSTQAEIFVGYSTATGATANDGENATNSPFAAAFVESIKQQGKDISGVYKDITAKVVQNTNNSQRPWNGGSLTREFYFLPVAKTVDKPNLVNPIVTPAKPEVEKPVVTETPEKPVTTPTKPNNSNTIIPQNNSNDVFSDCMVYVSGGNFMMGYPPEEKGRGAAPLRNVTIKDYYISKYEVTQAQWNSIMGTNPSEITNCDKCPVEHISWDDVQKFILKLNAKTGKNYRLPTEPEWEYAAKGGNRSKNYKYSGSNNIELVANYKNSKTSPVGSKTSNELGIYDMSGNVKEWCSDKYECFNCSGEVSTMTGNFRIVKGGNCQSESQDCLNWLRFGSDPNKKGNLVGFRLAVSK